jgi:ArsR family transcriptional regulator
MEVFLKNIDINPFEEYTTIFKALGDTTRLKIMWLLFTVDLKVSVSEIIDVLGESQCNVSKHLKILKNAGLIYEKKEGRWSFYYYLENDNKFHEYIQKAILQIPKENMEEEVYRCKKRLAMRVDGKCVLNANINK